MSAKSLSKILCWAVGWEERYRFDSKHAINQTKGLTPVSGFNLGLTILSLALTYWCCILATFISVYLPMHFQSRPEALHARSHWRFSRFESRSASSECWKDSVAPKLRNGRNPPRLSHITSENFLGVRHIINKRCLVIHTKAAQFLQPNNMWVLHKFFTKTIRSRKKPSHNYKLQET